jgi:hypothetical protein
MEGRSRFRAAAVRVSHCRDAWRCLLSTHEGRPSTSGSKTTADHSPLAALSEPTLYPRSIEQPGVCTWAESSMTDCAPQGTCQAETCVRSRGAATGSPVSRPRASSATTPPRATSTRAWATSRPRSTCARRCECACWSSHLREVIRVYALDLVQ